jgi:hypothetical protein
MKNQSTYPLRLPRSVTAEVERRARQDRVPGSSVSRLASTQPAEPAPIMMQSACIFRAPRSYGSAHCQTASSRA